MLLKSSKRWCGNNRSTTGKSYCSKTTHFGFKTVPAEKKEELVAEVFHSVAESYDTMNDVMSFGVHRLWKDYFVQKLYPVPGMTLLDVAGGTGDIAFRCLNNIKRSPMFVSGSPNSRSKIIVLDINAEMLKVGRQRAETLNIDLRAEADPAFEFVEGNAQHLPLEDTSVDSYTIAFGIRNCTDINAVLQEAFRVLRPGGRFMCLEFSHVTNPILSTMYNLYSFNVIPPMGHLIASDFDSYKYLVESIRKFPTQEVFAEQIRSAGFQNVTYENLTFGVVAIHSGFKPFAEEKNHKSTE